jgi:hypothetical protein
MMIERIVCLGLTTSGAAIIPSREAVGVSQPLPTRRERVLGWGGFSIVR